MRILLLLLALFLLVQPALAAETGQGGGIEPVNVDEVAGKINSLLDNLYDLAKPAVAKLSRLLIAFAGVMALIGIFTGIKILMKAVFAVLAVGLGLFLFDNADTIVGLIYYFSDWFFK